MTNYCKKHSLCAMQIALCQLHGGLPSITYASRGVGGSTLMHTNAYKGGRGGLNMTKNTHFVCRFGSFRGKVAYLGDTFWISEIGF